MAFRLLLLCLLMSAGPAAAQTHEDLRRLGWEVYENPLSASPTAAGDIFEAQPNGLRHRISGKLCPKALEGFDLSAVSIVPPTSERPNRGDDIKCDYTTDRVPRAVVSLHISKSLFPSAHQSLQLTAAALERTPVPWRGWPVNMAPAEFGGANLAMTRGHVFLDNNVAVATDIWIASSPGLDHFFWEIKLRPIGEPAMRPLFDAFAVALYNSLPDIKGSDSAEPVIPEQAGIWRWERPEAAETSALIHVQSGLRCPAPPAGSSRYALNLEETRFRCRYIGEDGPLWTAVIRSGRGSNAPIETFRRMQETSSVQLNFDTLEAISIHGEEAAYAEGSSTLNTATFAQRWLGVRLSDYSISIDVTTSSGKQLPTRAQVERFAEDILPAEPE